MSQVSLLIAGSRGVNPTIDDINRELYGLFDSPIDASNVAEVVSGKCPRGADAAGESWARYYDIPIKAFPPDTTKHPIFAVAAKMRNRDMAEYAHCGLIFWDGMSSGSADMAIRMVVRGKTIRVVPMKAGRR